VRKILLNFGLNIISVLPLAVVQVFGALLGLLAYLGSKQYRSLFRPQYEAVVNARKLPFKLWEAVRASGMLFSDSL
jgi:KDO2-lipid IV(A) lauroyltransferase